MTSLHELGVHHSTDKAAHGYLEIYHNLFAGLRKQPIKLLEIGVDGGASLRMWCDYFYHKDSRIYGIDIQQKDFLIPEKAQVFFTDGTSPNAVYDISRAVGPFDIIVEDASHMVCDQKALIKQWFPHLKPGGIWSTEDTHSSYHYPWLDSGEIPFVHSLNEYIDEVNEHGAGHCGKPSTSLIEYILFRKSLVIIKKRV